ncbi:nicotinamide riboside transporter PnuC [Sphingomonas radiodurans]|uniref:nicotinamide riboside transporter PnuC n=1 Tax=Sphingomonas radiodurans TaxID=2890321 RepID=UPI001E540C44|nr:nicotinamide riboside transporter PnuC [Sphingomonas radiodurans]WBH16642.1 nicotinamide riboside transporter PnuC [Sphingomonas radiodurans]
MSLLEWLATLMGIACVALAALRSIWTFPVGIASVSLLGIVVFETGLYSDAALQMFFAIANLYGWQQWRQVRGALNAAKVVTMTNASRLAWAVSTLFGGIVLAVAMNRLTDASYPRWDASIAAVSVTAQLLMARRALESWWLWIAVDLASIPLYLAKGLQLFAGLYLIYLALAIAGLVSWRAAFRNERGDAR